MASSDVKTLPATPGPAPRWTPVLAGGLWTLSFLAFALGRAGRLPFEVALFGIATAGLVALGMGLWAAYQRWGQRQVPDSALLAAAPLGVLVLALAAWTFFRFPWLHDVAAAESPPTFSWLMPVEPEGAQVYGEAEAKTIGERYPSLQALRLSSRAERAFGHAVVAAGSLPSWRLERLSHRERRLEGTLRTSLGFESQLVVTVRPDGRGSIVEMRSRSNITTGDFGENARVIQRFIKHLGQTWMCRPPADFARKSG